MIFNMKIIGNILWIIFGGLILSLLWALVGVILCVTVFGIPFGMQCFKFANLMLFPFGREVVYGDGTVSFLFNVLWLIFFGFNLALWSLLIGCFWCVTIVGIPIGIQVIKFSKLALMPFGAKII